LPLSIKLIDLEQLHKDDPKSYTPIEIHFINFFDFNINSGLTLDYFSVKWKIETIENGTPKTYEFHIYAKVGVDAHALQIFSARVMMHYFFIIKYKLGNGYFNKIKDFDWKSEIFAQLKCAARVDELNNNDKKITNLLEANDEVYVNLVSNKYVHPCFVYGFLSNIVFNLFI
jgi:hypothetical protein